MTKITAATENEEILYIADYVTVVDNPKGYKIVKLTQKEMNAL